MTGTAAQPAQPPLRRRVVDLLGTLAELASREPDLDSVAQAATESACTATGALAGHVYQSSGPLGVVLGSGPVWGPGVARLGARPLRAIEESCVDAGVGPAGRCVDTGQPQWQPDLGAEDQWALSRYLIEAGFTSVLAVPVAVDGQVVAVMELFCGSQPDMDDPDIDDEVLALIAQVGHHLARLVERANAASALRASELGYQALAESSRDAVISLDDDEVVTGFNRRAEVMFGYRADEARGLPLAQLIPTMRRSLHDPLTDLPTRALLADRLQQSLARSDRNRSPLAVVSFDIDRFRAVNDSLGHGAGDLLLVTVARQLREALDPAGTLARVSADEFVAILDDVADAEAAVAVVRAALDHLDGRVELAGTEVELSMSAGIAWRRAGTGDDADLLIRSAEMAREQALASGRGQVAVFDETMRAEAARRAAAEADLRRALRESQFHVVYQPIIDLDTGTVTSLEALLRWRHPQRGQIAPLDFIPLAEETGLIVPIGQWVLEAAARQVAEWNSGRRERLRVGVNVSPRQVRQHDWVDQVAAVLVNTGIQPSDLVLEITESVLMDDPEVMAQRLAEVRALGVRIAVDDFGTGYSSLAYLRRFPVDVLKIDKMFIDNVAGDPQESALAQAVVRLAEAMGLDAVAEGVALPEQLAALVRMRCRYGQGFLFARPMDPADLTPLLDGRDLRP